MYLSKKFTISLSLLLLISTIHNSSLAMERNFDEEDSYQKAIQESLRQQEDEAYEDMLLQLSLQEDQDAKNNNNNTQQPKEIEHDEMLARALQEEEGNVPFPQQPNKSQQSQTQPIRQPQPPQLKAQQTSQQPIQPQPSQTTAPKQPTTTIQVKLTCKICLDQKITKEFNKLTCGHSFCNECLNQHIATGLQAKNTYGLLCPLPECKQPMVEADIRVINPAKLSEFAEIATQQWLNQNMNVCPTRDCGYPFEKVTTAQRITCPKCKKTRCQKCLLDHNPDTMNCTEAERTTNKSEADRASEQLVTRVTKPCPGCQSRIEKNEGCLHMTCRQCKHQFCWKCLTPWNQHRNNYVCGNAENNPINPTAQPQQNPNYAYPRMPNLQPIAFIFQEYNPAAIHHGRHVYQYTLRFNRNISQNSANQLVIDIHNFAGNNNIISANYQFVLGYERQLVIQTYLDRAQMERILAQANNRLLLFVNQF